MAKQNDFLKPLLDVMNDRMDRIEDKVDANTTLTQQTLTQAKYTNGRVTKLERQVAAEKAKKTAKKLNLPTPPVLYLIALGAVILLIIVATLLKVPLGGLL